jgi:Fe-S oxidoreductase
MININANNVSEFHISAKCIETNPCQHTCWFFFADGEPPISVDLYKEDIKSYLSQIDKNKILNLCGDEHFTQTTSLYPNINNSISDITSNYNNDDITSNYNNDIAYINRQTSTNNNNPLNIEINANQVSSFTISNECMESFPCKHKCTIVSDDAIVTKTLNRTEIKWCIDKIPQKNINYEGFNLTHFNAC